MTVAADYNEITAESTMATVNIPIDWDYQQDIANLFIIQENLTNGDTADSFDGSFTFTRNPDNSIDVDQSVLIPALTNTKYFVSRMLPLTQDYDLTENGVLNAEALEAQLDTMVRQTQDVSEDFSTRGITSLDSFDIPNKLVRANQLMTFDNNGDLLLVSAQAEQEAEYWADYAEVWASNPEDDPIPPFYGGDGATTFSSFHWAQKSEESSGTFDYVVDANGTGTHTSWQAAVDAAETRGTPWSMLVLGGSFTENVVINSSDWSITGTSNGSDVTTLNGNITINTPSMVNSSLSEVKINGEVELAGTSQILAYWRNVNIRNNGGTGCVNLTNSNGGSTLIPVNCSWCTEDDLAAPLTRTGAFNIDGNFTEICRNNGSGSQLPAIDYAGTGGGILILRNSLINGQVDLDSSSVAYTFSGGSAQHVITGTNSNITASGFFGTVFIFGANMAITGGGNVFAQNNLAQQFYANVIAGFGTVLDNSQATRITVDGVDLISNGAGTNVLSDNGGYVPLPTGSLNDYILLEDQKANGTAGGSVTASTWITKDLNTEVEDDGGHCTLSANQFTLAEGTYRIKARSPMHSVGGHVAKLVRDPSGSPTDEIIGSASRMGTSASTNNDSWIMGKFTVAGGGETFEIQHIATNTQSTNGRGEAVNEGVTEKYTQVELWKVG